MTGRAPELHVLRITPRFDWRAVGGAHLVGAHEPIGGQAVQVARIVQATGALGLAQTIVTMRPPGAPRSARMASGVTVRGVGPSRVAGLHRSHIAWLMALPAALLRRTGRRVDLVHVHASGIIEPLLAALAARFVLRRPLVLTLHCSARATYRSTSRRDALVQVLTRAAERAAMRVAARTLVLTERVRAELGSGDRIEVAPDSLDADAFRVDPVKVEHMARRLQIPPDARVIAFVGRISPEKGWSDVLEVAERLRSLEPHLLMCGSGRDLGRLKQAVDARRLGARTTIAGEVPVEQVPLVMGRADVVVLPSRHEELGSTLVEAMAAGVPAVAYAVGGVPEAIVDGVTGILVRPGDIDALTAAVARALTDDDLRDSARRLGPTRAAERHGTRSAAERLLGLYREVVR